MRVLEVGCGHDRGARGGPAIEQPGSLLVGEEIRYIGLDTPCGFREGGYMFDGFADEELRSVEPGLAERFRAVEANVAALPFKANVFDLVMLRSVFGQFRDWNSGMKGLDGRDLWGAGMTEMARVLKPLGKIVIAEENTPEEVNFVDHCLRAVDMEVTDFAEMQAHGFSERANNTNWYRIRSQYYGNSESILCLGSRMKGYDIPYVLVAEKPRESGT